jgi:hypothetical protein
VESRTQLVWLGAIVALTALVFRPLAGATYAFDDALLIAGNPLYDSWSNLLEIWSHDLWHRAPTASGGTYYRPLFQVTLLVDHTLFGPDAVPLRQAHNLAWHAGVVTLLGAWLLRRVDPIPALVMTAVFALNPLHDEIVHSLAARNDSMAAAGLLGTLLLLDRDRPVAGALCFLAGLLSKESVLLVLPAIPLLLEGSWRDRARRTLPLLAPLLVWGGLRAWIGMGEGGSPVEPELVARGAGWLTGCVAWPGPCHPLAPVREIQVPWVTLAATLAGIGGVIWAARHKALGPLTLALLAFVPALLGVGQSVRAGTRYLYVPLIGLAMACAPALRGRLRWAPVAVLPVWLFLCVQARPRWTDNATLWTGVHASWPNAVSGCSLFLATRDPALLPDAWPHPVCCDETSAAGLRESPAAALEWGHSALDAACPATPDLLAPMALAHALAGDWAQAAQVAHQASGDGWGYSPVVLAAEGLRRGDEGPLVTQAGPELARQDALRAAAQRLVDQAAP